MVMLLLPGNSKRAIAAVDLAPRFYGWLLTPSRTMTRSETLGLHYGFDNECYTGRFDAGAFERAVKRVRDHHGAKRCLFVAAPDVVGDAKATLRRAARWLDRIRGWGLPVALVAQDGLERLPVPWRDFDALFVGGTTDWKLSAAAGALMRLARRKGKWVHVGRVGSWTRIDALQARADSVDSTHFVYRPSKYLARWDRYLWERVRGGHYPFGEFKPCH